MQKNILNNFNSTFPSFSTQECLQEINLCLNYASNVLKNSQKREEKIKKEPLVYIAADLLKENYKTRKELLKILQEVKTRLNSFTVDESKNV